MTVSSIKREVLSLALERVAGTLGRKKMPTVHLENYLSPTSGLCWLPRVRGWCRSWLTDFTVLQKIKLSKCTLTNTISHKKNGWPCSDYLSAWMWAALIDNVFHSVIVTSGESITHLNFIYYYLALVLKQDQQNFTLPFLSYLTG